jgi:hypothetical protein
MTSSKFAQNTIQYFIDSNKTPKFFTIVEHMKYLNKWSMLTIGELDAKLIANLIIENNDHAVSAENLNPLQL